MRFGDRPVEGRFARDALERFPPGWSVPGIPGQRSGYLVSKPLALIHLPPPVVGPNRNRRAWSARILRQDATLLYETGTRGAKGPVGTEGEVRGNQRRSTRCSSSQGRRAALGHSSTPATRRAQDRIRFP